MGWVPIGNERATGAMFLPNGPTPVIAEPGGLPPVAAVPSPPEPPEAKALRDAGYMVIAPFTPAG